MASLLDWLTAVRLFQETGRSAPLAGLLQEIQNQAHRDRQLTPPRRLKNIAASLERLSEGLRLIRPLDAMEQAGVLGGQITPELLTEVETWARPFALVAPLVKEEVGRLAREPVAGNLAGQSALLDWYGAHEQPVHALTLAREMVVTWVVQGLGHGDPRDLSVRDEAEAVLALWDKRAAGREAEFRHRDPERIRGRAARLERGGVDVTEVAGLWARLSDARNDVNHAGMRPGQRSADNLTREAESLAADVRRLVAIRLFSN